MRSRSRSWLLGVLGIVVLSAATCSTGPTGDDDRNAAVYAEVVRWLLTAEVGSTDSDVPAFEPEDERPVFIEPIGPDGIDLEVQVGVIDRLQDLAVVRFVDTRDEALDMSEPHVPVRDEGVLIALGVITDDLPTVVRGERYLDNTDIAAFRFTMQSRAGDWEVFGEPEPVEPESLTVTP